MENKRIILIDDHIIVRSGLKELIEKLGPYSVVAEYDSGKVFIEELPLEENPDLIILDINMPDMKGDQVLEKLTENGFKVPVLILTLDSEEELVIRAFRNGSRGFLKKNCSAKELRNAIQSILDSGYYHNEFLTFSLINNQKKYNKKESILEQLSVREREFLKYVCDENEYTYEQIADKMNVQARTVDGYRESLFEKFGIRSKTGLVLFVLKHELFQVL